MIRISRLNHYNLVGKICCRRAFVTTSGCRLTGEQGAKDALVLLPFVCKRFTAFYLDAVGLSVKLRLPFRNNSEQQSPSLREGALYGHV